MEGATENVIDQIMLKFRPIAPKPVTAGSDNSSLLRDRIIKRKRVKRKYVRVKQRKSSKNNNNNNDNSLSINDKTTSWLDLEKMIDVCNGNELIVTDPSQKVSNWISFGVPKNIIGKITDSGTLDRSSSSDLHGTDLTIGVQRQKSVESWITMESVTGTCDDRKLLGYCDDEIVKNLEGDRCPGFISNGYDEVVWVNQSYRKMLDLKDDKDGSPVSEVAVWLVVKVEKSKMIRYLPALSCRVRIEYRLSEKKTQTMVVPCDVCMMDSGGFAWRLDVESALSLGPIN